MAKTATKPRKQKKGLMYLFISPDKSTLKFGVTQNSIRKRLLYWRRFYSIEFEIAFVLPSNDIFKSEKEFKWWLWGKSCPIDSELFSDNIELDIIKNKIRELCCG